MRNGSVYGLAVRLPDGRIIGSRRAWRTLFGQSWSKKPFLRGFPTLVETLYNGVKSLNASVLLGETAAGAEHDDVSRWQLVASLVFAMFFAVVLFVITPHLLSLLMLWLQWGGDLDSLSFHVWDGFFKSCIFLGYVWLISFVPEIRSVFRYHGAEHKTIHAFEREGDVSVSVAARMSRLHPRCGTTFLLFVISLSILSHAILVPVGLMVYAPESALLRHTLTIVFKIALIIPISALAYELIRYAGRLRENGVWTSLLQAPGMCLQRLTTAEPTPDQLEVAIVALYLALEQGERARLSVPDFVMEDGEDLIAGNS